MNSIQQIAMGAGCLLAAFAFGSYINHTPPVGEESTTAGAALPVDPLDLGLEQPVAIPRLKARAKPLLALSESAEASADPSLPPPSELAQPRGGVALGGGTPLPKADAIEGAAPPQAPDFASIAAEFRGTPIDLDGGGMPTLELPDAPPLNQLVLQPGKTTAPPLETAPQFFDDPSPGDNPAVDQPIHADPGAGHGLGRISSVEPIVEPSANAMATKDGVAGRGSILGVQSAAVDSGDRVVSRNGDLKAMISPPPAAADQPLPAAVEIPTPPRQVTGRIPFGLTPSARTELARLRDEAVGKIALETTEFTSHQVQPGETLQSISTRYLGRPDFYLDIYLANRNQCRHPGDLKAGMSLKVPVYRD